MFSLCIECIIVTTVRENGYNIFPVGEIRSAQWGQRNKKIREK